MATAKKPVPAPKALGDPRRSAFRIRAGSLKAALGDIAQVVAARNTVPICSMVLVQAGDGLLTLAATNLDIWAARDLATDDREPNVSAGGSAAPDGSATAGSWRASIRPFAVCVPAKTLLAILGEIDADAMVTVEALGVDGDEASATNGGPVKVTAGCSRWTLKSLPSADWPGAAPIQWECEFSIKATALADAFAAVDHAISTEETRYYLNGVYFHPDSGPGGALDLRMAATDGHRLARLAFDAPEGALGAPNVIVPRQVVSVLVKELARVADHGAVGVSFGHEGRTMLFTLPMPDDGTLLLQAKAIDGTFPDYTRVIPSVSTKRLTVNREALLGALRRVAVLAEGKTRAIKLIADNDGLTLIGASPELGEACEDVPCVYGGPPIEWGFDGRYFRDALQAVASDEARLVQVLVPLRV